MDLTGRLDELQGMLKASDEQLAGLRGQIDQAAQERLLLVGALLEVRRLLAPERQDTTDEAETTRPIETLSPGGTD